MEVPRGAAGEPSHLENGRGSDAGERTVAWVKSRRRHRAHRLQLRRMEGNRRGMARPDIQTFIVYPVALVVRRSHTKPGNPTQKVGASMMKITLMVCAALMLFASSGSAQDMVPVGPCTVDEKRLCAGVQGRDSVRACFREHMHELSDACLLALARFSAVDKTCRERLQRECASVEPGEGRLEACIRSAAAKLDDYCKAAFSRAIPGAGNVQ
jgi:hypothetical protein